VALTIQGLSVIEICFDFLLDEFLQEGFFLICLGDVNYVVSCFKALTRDLLEESWHFSQGRGFQVVREQEELTHLQDLFIFNS